MAAKRKHPKSFYDDGLGDMLDWIDDEVLVHSSENKLKRNDDSSPQKKKKLKRETKSRLYGDNELLDRKIGVPKRVIKFQDLDFEDSIKVDKKLEDRARGLINRLSAQTMPFVSSEFEKLYSSNSRSLVNAAIFNSIESSIISQHAITKRKLVAELMLLVSYLNHKISQDIGASLVHRLVQKFEALYRNEDVDEDKRLDNILNCLINLYIIGLISVNVIFEITKRICSQDFKVKSVELLLLVIKGIGFQLRKEAPLLMRQLIVMSQENSKKLKSNSEVGSRIEFMMEALGAIKNNNVNKMGNYGCDIDRDTIESTLKSLVHRTKLPEHLNDATYHEILNSQNWYLLETRPDEDGGRMDTKETVQVKATNSSKMDEKICKVLGFSRPAEKTIFSALLRVSDCVEASNVIIGFGLNHCSDAMSVCVQVAIHEKQYNPFYFNVINGMCKFNRKYKMAAKFAIQDKIRVLSRMALKRVDIFKTLCFELVKSDAIPITILKAVEWADLSSSTKEYLTFMLDSISELPSDEKRKIMSKVERKSSFAGAMRTFTNCFLKGCKLFQ